MDSVYRGGCGRYRGGRWGQVGSRKWVLLYIWAEKQPLCVHWSAQTTTVRLSGRYGCWQQFDTQCSRISVSQWHCILHSGLSWIYRVTEMMPVKANLIIWSSLIGMSGQCKSVAFMSSYYLDFSSCRIVPGFCKCMQSRTNFVFWDE